MKQSTMAWLEDEIGLLIHEIEQLPASPEKDSILVSAKLVADIAGEEADRMLQALLSRRRKAASRNPTR